MLVQDAERHPQLQICDILAGTTSEAVSIYRESIVGGYSTELMEAGLSDLTGGDIWPSADVLPGLLGTQEMDGNRPIE